jgi:hypothetical protein
VFEKSKVSPIPRVLAFNPHTVWPGFQRGHNLGHIVITHQIVIIYKNDVIGVQGSPVQKQITLSTCRHLAVVGVPQNGNIVLAGLGSETIHQPLQQVGPVLQMADQD